MCQLLRVFVFMFLYSRNCITAEKIDCTEIKHTFTVLIADESLQLRCGGTLLNSRWVLTAAHCGIVSMRVVIAGLSTSDIPKISKAEVDQKVEDDPLWAKIIRFAVHRKYDPTDNLNNVGLAKVHKAIKEGPTVSYVKMPRYRWKKHFHKECPEATAMSWGTMGSASQSSNIALPSNLQCITLDIFDSEKCNSINPDVRNREGVLCTKPIDSYGDDGGPLMCRNVQYGIKTMVKGVHVKVDSYIRFIGKTSKGSNIASIFSVVISCLHIIAI